MSKEERVGNPDKILKLEGGGRNYLKQVKASKICQKWWVQNRLGGERRWGGLEEIFFTFFKKKTFNLHVPK